MSRRAPADSVSDGRLVSASHCACAALAFGLWAFSLGSVDVSHLGSYGLPPALPASWYIALLISLAGMAAALTMRKTTSLAMLVYLVVIAVILYGTVPVLSGQPHYAWVYKHIGVVRYIEAHGSVNPNIDIYNRWPGFFAVVAALSELAGHANPATYANWAELFFMLIDTLLLVAAIRAIARSRRIAAGGALFFLITNWVGQAYFSPQAFAYVLALGIVVILLRHLRVQDGYSAFVVRTIERMGRVPQLPVEPGDRQRWPRFAATGIVLALYGVIVASHQLTPYMLLVGTFLLLLAGVVRPWWMLGAMAVMALGYFAANYQFIQHNYGVFTSIDPFNNVAVSQYTQTPVAGKVFNTHAQLLCAAVMWIGAFGATLRLWRRGLLVRALPLAVLAIAPFGVIFGANYGGEASLRIILFSSPWSAALIAWGLATVPRPRVRWTLTTLAAIVCAALFVPAFLGAEELNIISPAELRASEWFYYHARPGTVLLLSAPGFPYRYGGTYAEFKGPEGDANPNLLTEPIFQSRQLGAPEVSDVVERIQEYASGGYIAFTKDQTAFGEIMGITPPGALGALEHAIGDSSKFRLWYTNSDVQIYELRPKGLSTPSRAAHGSTPELVQWVPLSGAGQLRFSPRRKSASHERSRVTRSARRRQHVRSVA